MVKAKLYRKNHPQKHTHTHSQKEKKWRKYIYCFSQSPPPQLGLIRCLFRYFTDAGTSSWLWRFNLLLLRLLREISLSLLCSRSSWGSALDLASPLGLGRLRVCVLCSDRTGLKEQLIRWLWLTQAGGREGFGVLGEPAVAWRCTSLRHAVRSPGEVVPGSRDPGSGGLHRLPGGTVWIMTCACTQDFWWQQKQLYHPIPVSGVRADSHGSRPSLNLF